MDFPIFAPALRKPELALQSLVRQGFACARQRNWAAKTSRQTLVQVQAPVLALGRPPAEARIAWLARDRRLAPLAPRPCRATTILPAAPPVFSKRAVHTGSL